MSELDRILIVDDDAGLRRTLERILTPDYPVESVEGATEAMDLLTREEFALALVDVRLKDGDGYSLCQEIRRQRPDTDVILITGSISEPDEKLFRSLEEGAFYFLFKPFDRRVLLALVERCLRLKRERLTKERYAGTLAADLEKARLFQHSLLPSGSVTGAGWSLSGRLLSCDALGGDLYLAHWVEGTGIVFSISDVVGHGVSAAMVAGMLRSTLDAARRRSPEPERVARDLLAGIDFFEPAGCATLVFGLLLPDGRLRYVNAGHPPLLWQKRGEMETLPSTGILLHPAFRTRPLPAREVAVAPGDRLLLYTDGVFEARNPADQELGLERLSQAFAACRDLPAEETLDTLMGLVRDHCAGRPVDDDVTLLLIERTEYESAL
ncbi:MAG TPA: SpoIIE family protein phosphatase [Thermoanaerobaculia bacterium]|nr:SpoIIE family protein phosphatase [Thermoanaerobaculia bacterium]